jgi:DNA-binding response OmpR family regulator
MGNLTDAKPKLLIAEDDLENQKFLQLFLNKYFTVNICDSSITFYELLDKEKFDIILMDISIKGEKNGLQLTKELRESPNYSAIPIICYTAHALNRDRINALEAGCDVYLSKPSDIHTLLNALFDLLSVKGKFLMGSNSSLSFASTQ